MQHFVLGTVRTMKADKTWYLPEMKQMLHSAFHYSYNHLWGSISVLDDTPGFFQLSSHILLLRSFTNKNYFQRIKDNFSSVSVATEMIQEGFKSFPTFFFSSNPAYIISPFICPKEKSFFFFFFKIQVIALSYF